MNSLQDRGLRDGSRQGAPASAPARVIAPPPADATGVCPLLGPHTGFDALAQTLLACVPGRSEARTTGECEEVLFVLSGEGVLRAGGDAHALEPESGAYLAPGESYELEARGPEVLRLVAVTVPLEPGEAADAAGERAVVRRLADQESAMATTQREFRIVADPASGLRSATHFVGYIPTLRAPEHFHTYDEVIYVLDGDGVMHVDGADHRLTAGSSIQLPARTVHCLENTGAAVMRIVAVFRPAGSPAAAYYPDGTPAYTPYEEDIA
jgi:mannose-6-phosphate isomerase-like protein (cupin superfamily)